jgi:DNA-binding NarL/FixJ family response regulator
MENSSRRVLVVEDSEPFRKFISSTLGKRSELRIVGEVTDGLEAVQQAEKSHPDLILLDIGLPMLNGIEAARRIRTFSPDSKILFVSQEFSADVVHGALGTGAHGYVVKTDAGRELLKAVDAVLRGERFVGPRFSGSDFSEPSHVGPSEDLRSHNVGTPLQQTMEIVRRHEVGFYSDDTNLLDDLTQFIGAALRTGNAAIVIATEPHRNILLPTLQAQGLDIGGAIEQGKYISLDAAQTLLTFMVNDLPDPVQFSKLFWNLIAKTAQAAKEGRARVSVFGECAHLLWAQGKAEAAIQIEKLGNQLAEKYNVDILCGYCLRDLREVVDNQVFQTIRAEHSRVYTR